MGLVLSDFPVALLEREQENDTSVFVLGGEVGCTPRGGLLQLTLLLRFRPHAGFKVCDFLSQFFHITFIPFIIT